MFSSPAIFSQTLVIDWGKEPENAAVENTLNWIRTYPTPQTLSIHISPATRRNLAGLMLQRQLQSMGCRVVQLQSLGQ
ncbi:hypothetical protein HYZ98_02945 [Candidatus Peregrinibacteria bacterium]|nr:hypothetical protein [Candidatus Peregrinibacteria bacterium]